MSDSSEYRQQESKSFYQPPQAESFVGGTKKRLQILSNNIRFIPSYFRYLLIVAIPVFAFLMVSRLSLPQPLTYQTLQQKPLNSFSFDWWINPIEKNKVLRLSIIPSSQAASLDRIGVTTSNHLVVGNMKGDTFIVTEDATDDRKVDSDSINAMYGSLEKPVIRTVQFENESLDISDRYRAQLGVLAKYIISNPSVNITLEGNVKPGADDIKLSAKKAKAYLFEGADPKSYKSREYAIALGERYARAVRDFIISLGARPSQIRTISYGLERPFDVESLGLVNIVMDNEPAIEVAWQTLSASSDNFIDTNKGKFFWRLYREGLIALHDSENNFDELKAISFNLLEILLKENHPGYQFRLNANQLQWRYASSDWQSNLHYVYYLAPISYVIIFVAIGMMLVLAIRPIEPVLVGGSSGIVEHFATDSPIESAKSDRLGFLSLARAVSQFLRNAKTIAPLTIAITGKWGSGKSSLMKLLSEDLSKHKIRPVWINAWHHQNESEFLAGLLHSIHEQAIPPMLSMAHLMFRLKMLVRRIEKHPLLSLFYVALILVPVGILTSYDLTDISAETLKYITGSSIGSVIMSLIGITSLSREKLTSIGRSNIKKLFSVTSNQSEQIKAVGLRTQFAEEFSDVCNALGVTTLTIFVDDLDRCKEGRILDVLETVNFLITSGKCFVVLGMEREPIEKAVSAHYQSNFSDSDKDKLVAFSRRYLEKLINIEVPVPLADGDSYTKLLVTDEEKEESSWFRNVKQGLKGGMVVGFVIATFFLGAKLGDILSSYNDETQKMATASEKLIKNDADSDDNKNEPQTRIDNNINVNSDSSVDSNLDEQVKVIQPSLITNNSANEILQGVFGFAFILAVFILLESQNQRKRVLEHDSSAFSDSIAKWVEFLGEFKVTPRRIKRFINRSRFLSIMLKNSQATLTEEKLVILSLLHDVLPNSLKKINEVNDKVFSGIEESETSINVDLLVERIRQENIQVGQENLKEFKSWVMGIDVR